MGLIKDVLINLSLPWLISKQVLKSVFVSLKFLELWLPFFVYITCHCLTCHVIHVNWTNSIQITDIRLQVMVFSLYKKEITIHSYSKTNYEVKTRKSYWKLNSGCKMLSSEMSTSTLTTFVYVIHIFVPTTHQLSDINQYKDVFCCMCCHYMV